MGKHIQKQHPVYISFAKKIVRIVYGAHFNDHTDVIFQDLIFLKFCDLVKLKTCEVMYRAFNKTLPVNLITGCLICVKKDFVQKYTRTNLKAMSVSVVGAELWNELDSNLGNTTILLFKKKFKWGVGPYYPRTYHMIEYFRVEKPCSTLNIMVKLISLVS